VLNFFADVFYHLMYTLITYGRLDLVLRRFVNPRASRSVRFAGPVYRAARSGATELGPRSAYLFERSSFRHRQVGARRFESNTLWRASFAPRGRYNGRHFSVAGTRDRLAVRLFGRLGGPIADAVSRCASGLSRHFTRHRLYRRARARAGSCDSSTLPNRLDRIRTASPRRDSIA